MWSKSKKNIEDGKNVLFLQQKVNEKSDKNSLIVRRPYHISNSFPMTPYLTESEVNFSAKTEKKESFFQMSITPLELYGDSYSHYLSTRERKPVF